MSTANIIMVSYVLLTIVMRLSFPMTIHSIEQTNIGIPAFTSNVCSNGTSLARACFQLDQKRHLLQFANPFRDSAIQLGRVTRLLILIGVSTAGDKAL